MSMITSPLPRPQQALDQLPPNPTTEQVRQWVAALPIDDGLPGEPKDPDTSPLFQAYARLADPMRTETLRLRFLSGISWEDARLALEHLVLRRLAEDARRVAA